MAEVPLKAPLKAPLGTPLVLTLNAGSTSVKAALFEAGAARPAVWATTLEGLGVGGQPHAAALARLLGELRAGEHGRTIAAVGHRVVHGGAGFAGPARITPEVQAQIETLVPLAPLQQPHNLAGIRAVAESLPGVPQVACFDTAFHRTAPELNQHFALPQAWHARGIRRYGFHGLSYESICAQLAAQHPGAAQERIVIAHLGGGASMCAVQGLQSVATTMSFSPLDGLPMGTRCGRLDAAAVLHLWQEHGLTAPQIEQLLYRESGLLGLSGLSADMRVLLASAEPAAQRAVAYFVEHLQRELAGMAAALKGIDRLVFTGGIGENAATVRERVVQGAAWLLAAPGREVAVQVLRTDEEAVIAAHTAKLAALPAHGAAPAERY